MTLDEMITTLVDKGYSRDYAESRARLDFEELEAQEVNWDWPRFECSVCRKTFSELSFQYHVCE